MLTHRFSSREVKFSLQEFLIAIINEVVYFIIMGVGGKDMGGVDNINMKSVIAGKGMDKREN